MIRPVLTSLSYFIVGCSAAAPTVATSPPTAPVAAVKTSTAPAPPNPCATETAFRQFDFWVGDWTVFDLKGQRRGVNRISKAENGCLLVERWTSVRGNTGQSYNFYDPITGKWRQVWVSQGMSIDYAGGLRSDGAMVLEGEIHYHSGQSFPFRGTWSAQKDGSVRQHFEQFDPKTKAWNTWFTGIYRRP